MKHIDARVWTALVAIGVAVLTLPDRAMAQGAAGTEILTNESVVQMVVGKVPKDVMLTKIRSTSTAFDITANGLVSLYQRKVATDLLKAMMMAAGSNANKETLDNPAVLYMVSNGLPRDIIIAKIQSAKPGYDLTTAGLVSLNLNKVPPTVLKAMMASNSTGPSASGGGDAIRRCSAVDCGAGDRGAGAGDSLSGRRVSADEYRPDHGRAWHGQGQHGQGQEGSRGQEGRSGRQEKNRRKKVEIAPRPTSSSRPCLSRHPSAAPPVPRVV